MLKILEWIALALSVFAFIFSLYSHSTVKKRNIKIKIMYEDRQQNNYENEGE